MSGFHVKVKRKEIIIIREGESSLSLLESSGGRRRRMRKQLVDVVANDLLDLLAVVLDVNDPARQVEQALELDGEGVALKVKVGLVLERFRDGVRELGRRGGREDDLDDVGRAARGAFES